MAQFKNRQLKALYDMKNFKLILLTATFIYSCKAQPESIPYQVGQTYYFKVIVQEADSTITKTDTLSMTIRKKGVFGTLFGMNMANWSSESYPNITQKRGININEGSVQIQMPTVYDYLGNENIVIAGYPTFSENMKIGYTSEEKHKFVKGYGKLSGKNITQFSTVVDSINYFFSNDKLFCKVSEGKNLDMVEEFGQYKIRTLYSTEYGFMKIEYVYPDGKQIFIELIERKIEP